MTIVYRAFKDVGASVLPANQTLRPGQHLASINGRYRLVMRSDGHLVLEKEGAVIWTADASQPYSSTIRRKKLSEPLQFVVSNSGFLYDPSRNRIWIAESTHTLDKSFWYHNHLRLTDEGNIVIYDQRSGGVRWARFGFIPGRLPRPRLIDANQPAIKIWDWSWQV